MLVVDTTYNTYTFGSVDFNTTVNLTVIRAQMNTTEAIHSDNSIIYFVAPKLKFPGGTKGNRLKLQIRKQHGFVDSIRVTYKPKSIK